MRNSSIELLRILCIIGIVLMHILGYYWNTTDSVMRANILAVNSIANCGVTIFVLISGFYGIRFSVKKLFGLTNVVWFYTWTALLVMFICEALTMKYSVLIAFIFPILCGKYWFITAYCLIFCLAPYLNKIKELLTKKQFQILLGILTLFFYLAPTVTKTEILHDGGKGVVNLTTVYLIGQYFSKYGFHRFFDKYILWKIGGFIGIIFLLNVLSTTARDSICQPFSHDNSILILVTSILIFNYALKHEFFSEKVNKCAKFVLPIYILNGYFMRLLPHVEASPMLTLLACFGMALGICVVAAGIEKLRQISIGSFCEYVAETASQHIHVN